MFRTYDNFEKIKEDIKQNGPPMVYKYRTWTDENHKSLLKNKTVWFSHPFALEDPFDVRPEATFNALELQDRRFFDKLLRSVKECNPQLKTERELKQAAEERWLFLNLNPEVVLQNWDNYNEVSANFDSYGIFSTAMNPLVEVLWKRYADNFRGYCIGFNTVELCEGINSGFGYVKYSDDLFQYSFLEDTVRRDLKRLYLKKEVYSTENEFRFITVGVGVYRGRAQEYKNNAVRELILGHNSTDYEDEIKQTFNSNFHGLPIYRTVEGANGKLSKVLI